MLEVTDQAAFDELLTTDGPVLLGFVAKACGPCLQQRPVWEELGRTNDLVVGLVDVDVLPAVRDRYHVTGLPTTVLIQAGTVRDVSVGLRTTRQLLELLGLVAP